MDDKIGFDYSSPYPISQTQTVKHAQIMNDSIAQIKMFKTLVTVTMQMMAMMINIMKCCMHI